MNGNIYINGCIGTFLDENGNVKEKGVELIDVIMQVKNQPKATYFTVYINSPGGYVDTGFDIYDYLKSLNKPIKTVGQGMVASIATVIYMAGEQRMLRPNTEFMIHLPSGGVEGTASEIEGYSKYLKETEKRILKFYEQTAGLTESEIMPLLKNETWLNNDEAYKLGFATEKTIKSEPVAYFNKQKPNKKMSKNEQSVWAKIKKVLVDNKLMDENSTGKITPAISLKCLTPEQKKAKAKIVFDAEGNELDFYELEDGATIEVGSKANYDGKPANGEYLVQSEEDASIVLTYIFENGVLAEIKEPEAEPDNEDEMTALKAEVEALKTQVQEITAKKTELETENKNYKKVIMAIKKLETEKEPDTTKKFKPNPNATPPSETSAAVANWRKNKQLKTKK